jgi:hypothetical protein
MATIALLIGVAAAAWVWGGDGGDPSHPRSDRVLGDPRRPTPSTPEKPLVRSPGTVVLDTTDGFDAVAAAKVLGEREISVLKPYVDSVTAFVTTQDTTTTGTWLFTIRLGQRPADLLDDLNSLHTDVGFRVHEGSPPGTTVLVAGAPPGEPGTATYRAHYVSTLGVVRVEAYGPDSTQVEAAFSALLDAQLKNTPQFD